MERGGRGEEWDHKGRVGKRMWSLYIVEYIKLVTLQPPFNYSNNYDYDYDNHENNYDYSDYDYYCNYDYDCD